MRLLLILFIVIYSGFLSAHKNTGLELNDNGTVIGLPHKYEPASFERKSFIIEIAKKKIIIPECIKHSIGVNNELDYSIDLSASWYHNSSDLPPYLNVSVFPVAGKFKYHLLLNLDSLELIEAVKADKPSNIIGFRHSRLPIDFSPECLGLIKITAV